MFRPMLVAIAVFCASACAPTEENSDDVRRSVADLVQRWSDAGEAGEWDVVADTYADTEGFVWIEEGDARYTSRSAIVEGLNQARTMSASIRNDVADIVVTPLGDDAAAFRARYQLDVTADGFSFSSEGMLSGVAIRQGDAWRFLQGSFSERPPSRDRQ